MTIPALNLLVLRCRDIEDTRQFYETLGIRFRQEQHGTGPVHYAAELGGLVLEPYPTKGEPDNTRLGFKLGTGETCRVLADPDGRKVEVYGA